MLRFFVLAFLAFELVSANPQCLDENADPVDWFIVYKFPYIKDMHNDKVFGGYNYAFMTSKAYDGWHLSTFQTTNPHSIFGQTLNQIYKNQTTNHAFYNDQPPGDERVPSSYAHAKGVVAGNEKSGFWLIHTVPHFAPGAGHYDYVHSGGRFGQVAMCISLTSNQLTNVVDHQLRVAQPFTYSVQPGTIDSPLSRAVKALKNKEWRKESFSDITVKSIGGVEFRSFYKSPTDHIDLYSGIVAPALNSPLQVETWRKNPGGPLDSECTKKATKVENVNGIKVSFVNSNEKGFFDYKEDHSKWAMTEAATDLNTVCIGDINRVESQFKRGGGTTCLKNPSVWKAFNSYIGGTDKCH